MITKYTLSGGQWSGMAAASPIHRGMLGKQRMISITRCIRPSVHPPRYPETPPSVRPSIRLIKTPTIPMDNDMRLPYRQRENMSRPMRSVPNRNTLPGSSTPKRCMSPFQSPQNLYGSPREKEADRISLVFQFFVPDLLGIEVNIEFQGIDEGAVQIPLVVENPDGWWVVRK